MKTKICIMFLLSVMLCSCAKDEQTTRSGEKALTNEEFISTVVGNYWVNEELYTCRHEAGQTVRLTGDLWGAVLGVSQCMYYFPDEGTVRVYRMMLDPAFTEKYGDVMVYSDHASAFDPMSGVWSLEGYAEIPKSPLTVTQVSASEFWAECPVAFPVEGGAFDLAAFRIRDRATAESYVEDAIPVSEIELP